jgi:mRNA-degrading endonuclease RelE of RelBE toxin-antitoxin system
MKKYTVLRTVRLTENQLKDLEKMAEEHQRKVSDIIRIAITEKIANNRQGGRKHANRSSNI